MNTTLELQSGQSLAPSHIKNAGKVHSVLSFVHVDYTSETLNTSLQFYYAIIE